MATNTSTPVHDPGETTQLRHIPLSRIVVPNGFNPRGEIVEDRELEQLAESMRRHGCLQPVRVRPTETGDYLLIAGARRYRAAVKAALMEIPAIVRPAGGGDDEEQADLLVEAVIENDLRVDLDPLARARGYRRLIDTGLTIKGVAERLATTQARVREHLRILKLPEDAQAKLAAGEVPLRAVKALEGLAAIHPGLAAAAIAQVLKPTDEYEPYTWGDLEHQPLEVATLAGDELPDGVYRPYVSYPVDTFTLSDQAQKDLTALEQLIGGSLREVRFSHEDVDEGRKLGAAHGEHHRVVIVGEDVVNQLAGDYIARCLKVQRASDRRERQAGGHQRGRDSETRGAEADAQAEREAEEARRAEREAEREARERATVFNGDLGRAVYSTLSRVKVDERTLKILASVNVTGELGDLAMRGARYCLPGWVQETTQRNGKTKYVYIDQRAEAERKASEYLAGAAKASELAGRQIALIAMAVYADQQAVAMSNRSWHHVACSGPWAIEVNGLLDELVVEKLPEALVATLAPMLEERKAHREEKLDEHQAREEAAARLEGLEERIGELGAEDLDQVDEDLAAAWAGWTPRQSELRDLVKARRAALAPEQTEQSD
jgi:ParB/RepB/Spo0J family partition protein